MPRGKKEGRTSDSRYEGKLYLTLLGRYGGWEEKAKQTANQAAIERAAGVQDFKTGYSLIQPVLMRTSVPGALWGLYRSFICEIISKVRNKKIASVDDIIEKWIVYGLDGSVLGECVDAIGQVMITDAPTPKTV